MEDVVLHHRLEGSDGLSDLIATAEKLLEPFPRRPPPVFTPWFSDSSARRPAPIRPAKRAPVIHAADVKCPPEALKEAVRGPTNSPSVVDKKSASVATAAAAAVKRSWSVLASKSVRHRSPSLSKGFRHALSVHALHLRQRSKWVISQHNCGAARDIEQVQTWQPSAMSVSSRASPQSK